MMKRYILLVATAMATIACSNDTNEEVLSGYQPSTNPIAFDVTAEPAATRATGEIANTDALKASAKGFGVFACYTGNIRYEYTSVMPDFMYNQQVTYATSAWTYAPVKYWPNQASDFITFFAYAPYEASPDGSKCIAEFSKADDLGDPWLVYKIAQDPWSATNPQVDLLYGVNEGSTADAADDQPWYDQQKTGYDVDDKLTFSFKHALACFGDKITIKLSDELNTLIETYATITLNKVVIDYTNLTSKARLVLNSRNAPNWKAIVSGDVAVTRTYTKDLSSSPQLLSTTEYTLSTGDGLFYIPLQVASAKQQAVITVYYTVNNGISSYDGEATKAIVLNEKIGEKEGLALTLTKDLDLAHLVYTISTESAIGPSYIRKR